MTRYKDFPPGWNHILVPTTSRAAAKAGLAMYTPCGWRGEATQTLTWMGIALLGPSILPGKSVTWSPPEPPDRWARLIGKLEKLVGRFDDHVVYERREGRPGVLLVLIRDGVTLAFVKIRLEPGSAVADEARALELIGTRPHPSFSAPQLMATGEIADWTYLVTSPLPAGRHRMVSPGPPAGLYGEASDALADLPRPDDTPEHWRPMHGDLTPWNLRTFGNGPWLIDWESSGWGPPHADEVLYRATASALGRPVDSEGPEDVAEAVAHWREVIEARATERSRNGLPAESIDAATLAALDRLDATAATT